MCFRKQLNTHVLLFLFAISSALWLEAFGMLVDYSENTEFIQQRVGHDVKLQCVLHGLIDNEKLADVKVHWYFKQCGDSSIVPNNCHEFPEDEWAELPCDKNFCQPDLLLRNVTEKYSGLYKCTVYPYKLTAGQKPEIQLVRTYQLEVRNTSVAVPEFLEFPLNKTAAVGAQVVFQCRVHSEVHPTIKWFRRKPELPIEYALSSVDNFNAHIVRYNGHTYELLATAREKFINDDIYLSKLILNGALPQDEGYYACAAISYQGHKIREAYLKMLPFSAHEEERGWPDYDILEEAHTDPSEFWLLFLMPLGLAMLPLSVWICYVFYKRYRRSADLRGVEQRFFEEDISAENCMLRA